MRAISLGAFFLTWLAQPSAQAAPPAPKPKSSLQEVSVMLSSHELDEVRRALERSHGRVEEAARLLGISRKGLFLKRRRWAGRQPS